MMVLVKRLVLDVLKPHQPNGLEFAKTLAEQGGECRVSLVVSEVDEKTETLVVTVEGDSIPFDQLEEAIKSMGGSLHSVDEVEVVSSATDSEVG